MFETLAPVAPARLWRDRIVQNPCQIKAVSRQRGQTGIEATTFPPWASRPHLCTTAQTSYGLWSTRVVTSGLKLRDSAKHRGVKRRAFGPTIILAQHVC